MCPVYCQLTLLLDQPINKQSSEIYFSFVYSSYLYSYQNVITHKLCYFLPPPVTLHASQKLMTHFSALLWFKHDRSSILPACADWNVPLNLSTLKCSSLRQECCMVRTNYWRICSIKIFLKHTFKDHEEFYLFNCLFYAQFLSAHYLCAITLSSKEVKLLQCRKWEDTHSVMYFFI